MPKFAVACFEPKRPMGDGACPQTALTDWWRAPRGSVRDLEGILIQLVTTAALLKKPIDIELTERAIAQKSATRPSSKKGLKLAEIIELVSAFFKTSPDRPAGSVPGPSGFDSPAGHDVSRSPIHGCLHG